MSDFSLKNKVIVITGGVGLLGREYAKACQQAGAKVFLIDVKDSAGFDLPHGVFYSKADITDKSAVKSVFDHIIRTAGTIDVLVNNASMNPVPGSAESMKQFGPYEDYPLELWDHEIAVGLSGMLLCTQAVIPIMKKAGRGSIINIASTYGLVGPDNMIYDEGKFKSIGYVTTKGAVPNFTRGFASYLRGTGIRVNTLTPGGVFAGQDPKFEKKYSERTLLCRMAQKNEYNGALIFLASDASSYMTGSNLIVDGGWTAW